MPSPVLIRPETSADFPAIAEVLRFSFDKTDGSEVSRVANLRHLSDYLPELSLVALLEDRIVGYAKFHFVTLEGEFPARVLDLGPVAVLPKFQKQGVGTALVNKGLSLCVSRGEALVMCLGHDDYYPRFGSVPAARFGILPFWNAMMVYLIGENLECFRGLKYLHS